MCGAGRLSGGHSSSGAQSKSLGQFTLNENDTAASIGSNPGGDIADRGGRHQLQGVGRKVAAAIGLAA